MFEVGAGGEARRAGLRAAGDDGAVERGLGVVDVEEVVEVRVHAHGDGVHGGRAVDGYEEDVRGGEGGEDVGVGGEFGNGHDEGRVRSLIL